jgi:hypothetical protein
VLGGCTSVQLTQNSISVEINADKQIVNAQVPDGSTVQQVLDAARITLGNLDKVQPGLSFLLSAGDEVQVIRVREESYSREIVIPFEHQELKNEAIPEGETRLSQAGVNGLQRDTYLRVFEDGVQVSDVLIKNEVIQQSVPEILMVGSHPRFTSFPIPGKLAYISDGNAWVIESATGNRRCVVSNGQLDGRIFSISRDGSLLLFSQFLSEDLAINSLWIATLNDNPAKIIDLGVRNVIHFAEFSPDSTVVAYSTAEYRDTTPGWQANNDLYTVGVGPGGSVGSPVNVLEANSGGAYGWWGMDFSWSTGSNRLLFSRPDELGVVNVSSRVLTSVLIIDPFETNGDWAWVPGAAWSPDGSFIYAVNHATVGGVEAVESNQFNLVAILVDNGTPMTLAINVGMFAYPVPSPVNVKPALINSEPGEILNEKSFSVAYLQALSPGTSETSDYRLFIMDRDGSNRIGLFPEEGGRGLEPQRVVWSPSSLETDDNYAIAVIYNGNIWIVDAGNGVAQQITGDGLTSRIDWR